MIIKEFRIAQPLTMEEFDFGNRYTIARSNLEEAGNRQAHGVDYVASKQFQGMDIFKSDNKENSSGLYTKKVYHLDKQPPVEDYWKTNAPKDSLEIHEQTWYSWPYIKTVASNPTYMKNRFYIHIDTIHLADRGDTENVHKLSGKQLEDREVVYIDIARAKLDKFDYKVAEDPSLVTIDKCDPPIGPLTGNWLGKLDAISTAYKLVKIKFDWDGEDLDTEYFFMACQERIFTLFNRRLYCWMNGEKK